ncbi:hypothetical protein HDU99_005456 [Rhizoclosmatium hyalinum]|nr:hypothetical protein HDU99_005456 [Rhizoclosmatium hyalinum]
MSGETVYSAVDIDESTRKGDLANPNEYAEKDDALWASGVPQDKKRFGSINRDMFMTSRSTESSAISEMFARRTAEWKANKKCMTIFVVCVVIFSLALGLGLGLSLRKNAGATVESSNGAAGVAGAVDPSSAAPLPPSTTKNVLNPGQNGAFWNKTATTTRVQGIFWNSVSFTPYSGAKTSVSGIKTSTTAAPTTNRATSDVRTSATLDVVRTTSQLVVPTTTSSVIPPTTTSEIPTTSAWVPPPTTTTSDVPTTSQWVEPQTTAAITTAQQWNDPKATTDVVWTTQAQWVDPKATSDVPTTTAAGNNGGSGGGWGSGGGGGGGSGNVASIISREAFNNALSNCGVHNDKLYDGITQGLGISLAGLGELALLLGNMAWESGNFEVTIEQGCGDGSCPGGSKYFGHGFIQLTWEANYRAAADALGRPDIVDHPENVSNDADTDWAVSGWYWIQRVQPALQANGYTIGASVKEINAGYECNGNSIQQGRVDKIQCYQREFGVNVDYNPSC